VTVRRVLRNVGAALVAVGVLLLLFVGYELWGTGLITAGHQRALRNQFDQELRQAGVAIPTSPPGTTGTTVPSSRGLVPSTGTATDGQPIAIIQIPRIGVDFVVVQGTDEADLERGPGHYVNTAFPGNPGNAAIAGHRTTYLHPYYHLDALAPGDPIFVTTTQGRFRYDVTRTRVVRPTDVAVLDATATPTLTLTTCNPRYSASTRMVVTADLVTPAAAGAARPGGVPPAATLSSSGGSRAGALVWGTACLVVAAGVWLAHRRYRRWWVYAGGLAVVLATLLPLFANLGPLLPTGY
jgi:sortase A